MSPFKEPQPRKNSVEKDGEKDGEKVIGGNWPPYERLGSEARWDPAKETGQEPYVRTPPGTFYAANQKPITPQPAGTEPSPNAQWTMTEAEFFKELDTAREEGRAEAQVRKAALEAAVQHFTGVNRNGDLTIELAAKFEDYLRNGKPS